MLMARGLIYPESINIPLWDKVKVRTLMAHTNVKFNLMVKQDNTWCAPRTETKGIEKSQVPGRGIE